jgi:crossover junction endodeoxyribonuclease RuvC
MFASGDDRVVSRSYSLFVPIMVYIAHSSVMNHTTILGIDPGTRITGYGIVRSHMSKMIPLDFGCIRTNPASSSAEKYFSLFVAIEELIEIHCPDVVAVETQFVYKNVQSAIKLGMARGAALIASAKRNIPVYEYAPKRIKRALGAGNANKKEVQRLVQFLLGLPAVPEPEDAADALAIAVCHANCLCMNSFVVR